MAAVRRVPDVDELYRAISRDYAPPDLLRRHIFTLGLGLAGPVRDHLDRLVGGQPSILCVVILRGGLLMYPGFCGEFVDADFSLLAMRRDTAGAPVCTYLTPPARRGYDAVVLLDCVAATGGTLLAARRVLEQSCAATRYVTAVICSSRRATGVVTAAGIDVLGYSLDESMDGDVVTPDLGEMDAGDLVSGVSALVRNVSGT